MTASHVLARFDPEKPTILKIDWIVRGMSWILMQPADDPESLKSTHTLLTEETFLFELAADVSRLRPVQYVSLACIDKERWFRSFTGELYCGIWAIGQNKKDLWVSFF